MSAFSQRLAAERMLAIFYGLYIKTEMSATAALYKLVGMHQRKLSFELLHSQYAVHPPGEGL